MIRQRALAREAREADEVARREREGLGSDRACRPRPGREADQQRLGEQAADAEVGGHDDQHCDRRDHQDDVREDAEDVVDDAAEVAAGEADRHPDQRGDAPGDRADDEAGAQPVHELGEDVLAGRRRAEPVLRGGRLSERVVELERVAVGEHRPEDRDERAGRAGARARRRASCCGRRSGASRCACARGTRAGRGDDGAGVRDDGLGLRVGGPPSTSPGVPSACAGRRSRRRCRR